FSFMAALSLYCNIVGNRCVGRGTPLPGFANVATGSGCSRLRRSLERKVLVVGSAHHQHRSI
ncbi:MAG TPA: hypothetical protein VFB60_06530, partial [Ktedonobacteraceae bacterium]|nr:hypothetical protein [Ktedonobacteraceae bacterium]